MKRRTGKLEVTSPAGVPRGSWLQIGEGEQSDLVQVLAAHGTTLKIGRVRWYHRAWWWLQALTGGCERRLCPELLKELQQDQPVIAQ